MSWAQKHAAAWEQFLLSRGYSAEDAKRLGGFFGAQDALETGDGTNRGARELNNFGGMRTANGYKKYDSTEAYMTDKLSMMQRKFGDALNAQSIDEFAQILGDPARAGKHQLYYVTDKVKYNPNNWAWRDAQTRHMYNYINGMRSKAGMQSINFGPYQLKQPQKLTPVEAKNPTLAANASRWTPNVSLQTPTLTQPKITLPEPTPKQEVPEINRARRNGLFQSMMQLAGLNDIFGL